MPTNSLLSDNQVAFKDLEQARRDLIINILEEQRQLGAQIEKLKSRFDSNKSMLMKLADKQPEAQPEQQPEGVSI